MPPPGCVVLWDYTVAEVVALADSAVEPTVPRDG